MSRHLVRSYFGPPYHNNKNLIYLAAIVDIILDGVHMTSERYGYMLARLRERRPLIHHITNFVTANDCANITMCIGGSPIMADAVEEVSDMVSISNALVLNIGTLNAVQVASMIKAGKRANEIDIPVVLDPVGVGATRFRTEMTLKIMNEVKISILKGNAGEIGVLAGTGGKVRGVDSEGTGSDVIQGSKVLAERSGSIVISSGATDVITDGERTFLVDNGHNMMGSISGTGCMATSIVASFATVSDERIGT